MKFPRFLFVFLLIVLLVPGILMFVPETRGGALFGVQETVLKRKSTFSIIFGNRNVYESMAKQRVGFCNHGVRLYNELNYRLFHYSSAPKLILGKEDCFYENLYLDEYMGKDFIGEDVIRNKVILFKHLQDSLHRQGTELLLILEPGKARFEPEFLPNGCKKGERTNFDRFLFYCKKYNVRMLDLNSYFCSIKKQSEHPLYSKHGIHWTTFGLWTAADTLQKYIEQQCRVQLPVFKHIGDSISDQNKDLDFDLEPPMNLLSQLQHEKLCFPIMQPVEFPSTRMKALIIADSYTWGLWDRGILTHWFAEPEFWYYYNTVYPDIWEPNVIFADKRHISKKVSDKDVVLLMITDANLRDFGWGFLEDLTKAN